MTKNNKWKRPQDVVTFRTDDPKKMLGKYLPNPVFKTWTEYFTDESTGEVISIERKDLIMSSGTEITQDKLQQLMFSIQAGEIKDVEVCEDDVPKMKVRTSNYLMPYSLEFERFGERIIKDHYICYAQDVNQAIRIASEFGQMYKGLGGSVTVNKVVAIDAEMVPDNHPCIPEEDRKPAEERKEYFKVQVRIEWVENFKLHKLDRYYIVASKDVGEAKERIALLRDILNAEAKKDINHVAENGSKRETIRKAVPFEVDCIVPIGFSELYLQKVEE